MMNNTIIRRKGEIKTEAELKTLLENRGGKNFAERIFIESCVNQISNKSLQRLLLKGYWGTHAALKYARDKQKFFLVSSHGSIDITECLYEVKSIFVCKIPLGTQNLMQKPYFAAG